MWAQSKSSHRRCTNGLLLLKNARTRHSDFALSAKAQHWVTCRSHGGNAL